MKEQLEKAILEATQKQGILKPVVHLEHPEDNTFGDFSTNIALIYSKQLKISPKSLAEKIVEELNKNLPEDVEAVSIAGPGFVNFKLKDAYFFNGIKNLLEKGESIGRISFDSGKKVMVEYTDPNPFKIFHIGHLMANTIGESLSRIVEFSGAKVVRACYQGDVGLHVAKTLWAVLKNKDKFPEASLPLKERIKFLGEMYVLGSTKYEIDEISKDEITIINKKVFDKSDEQLNEFYRKGKDWSLEYFDTIYRKLGTKFDIFFFESEVALDGVKIVKEFLAKGVFENSDGAVVFPGEKYGEHTRVFINSQGLPTYEAKELGLIKKKFELYPDLSESISVTASEQDAYFKVISATLRAISPEIASKVKHISHGILRPSTGKMSSRKGNIVQAEDLIKEFESLVEEKLKDRNFEKKEHEEVRQDVAIAGLKYMILRQAIGGDIIYDPTKAVSFEGDSGPYLQYAVVRANAVLVKAKESGIPEKIEIIPDRVELLEKLLIRFPEVIEHARIEYAPHYIVTYLTGLASAFNSYYANNQIINIKDSLSPYRVSLVKVFVKIMSNGLLVLGIKVPKRM